MGGRGRERSGIGWDRKQDVSSPLPLTKENGVIAAEGKRKSQITGALSRFRETEQQQRGKFPRPRSRSRSCDHAQIRIS
jgi:hypothetical protein